MEVNGYGQLLGYPHFCVQHKKEVHTCFECLGWENENIIFIFVWTIPLRMLPFQPVSCYTSQWLK